MLQARGLRVARGTTSSFSIRERTLFHELDLTCNAGEIVGVVGTSGSGKTTLLRILAGLDDPDEGVVVFGNSDGHQWGWPTYRRKVCFVHQQAVIGEGSIREILNFPFSLAVSERSTFDEVEAIALLEAVNLPAQFGTEARNLSIGEKQRLALVRALLVRPQVLLLDEPTSALDAVNREAVETLLKARVRDGLAVVVVTHDATQATRLCDRLVTLDDRGPTAQTPGGHPAPGSRHG